MVKDNNKNKNNNSTDSMVFGRRQKLSGPIWPNLCILSYFCPPKSAAKQTFNSMEDMNCWTFTRELLKDPQLSREKE